MILYNDGNVKFIVMDTGVDRVSSLLVLQGDGNVIFNDGFYSVFDVNVKYNVFCGKSGTYRYYKYTISGDNTGYELVFVDKGVVQLIYRDTEFVDLKNTRLVITTVKGGIKVKRVKKER